MSVGIRGVARCRWAGVVVVKRRDGVGASGAVHWGSAGMQGRRGMENAGGTRWESGVFWDKMMGSNVLTGAHSFSDLELT